MKQIAGMLGVLALAATVACAQQTTPPPAATSAPAAAATTAPAAKPAAPSGMVKVGLVTLPPNGDPVQLGPIGPWAHWGHQVFDSMTMIEDRGNRIDPRIATSWRMLEPTLWEFKIRDGVKFQDGSTLTAEDVAFTIQKLQSDEYLRGVSPRVKGMSATVIDPMTVHIRTPQPEGFMAPLMVDIDIQPKAYIERVGQRGFEAAPIGTGPYKVTEFVGEQKAVMEAFTDSFRWQAGGPKTLEFYQMPETGARTAALRSGELDIIAAVNPDQAAELERDGNTVHSQLGQQYTRWQFSTEEPQMRDTRVRQAFNYAVDKNAIVQALYGRYGEALPGQLLGPNVFGFNSDVKEYPFDTARARQLLAEAGFPNGMATELKFAVGTVGASETSLITAENLNRAGIRAEVRQMEPAILIGETRAIGQRSGAYLLPGGGTFDGLAPLAQFESTNPRLYADNKELDRLIQTATSELDLERRRAALREAVKVMRDDPPVIFLYFTPSIWATGPKLKDFKLHDSGRWFLEGVTATR